MVLSKVSAKAILPISRENIRKHLQTIYTKFIKPGSAFELNKSSALKHEFETAMKSESPDLQILAAVNAEVLKPVFANAFFKLVRRLKEEKAVINYL
jgi:hypothetical protein